MSEVKSLFSLEVIERTPNYKRSDDQRHIYNIWKKVGKYPTPREYSCTRIRPYSPSIYMKDYRAFLIASFTRVNELGRIVFSPDLYRCDGEKPLSVLAKRYRGENKNSALVWLVGKMMDKRMRARAGAGYCEVNDRIFKDDIFTIEDHEIVRGFMLPWPRVEDFENKYQYHRFNNDLMVLMKETDFCFYHNFGSYIFINPNYFMMWLKRRVRNLIYRMLKWNLHYHVIHLELRNLNVDNVLFLDYEVIRSRYDLYRRGWGYIYRIYSSRNLGGIKLSSR